MWAVLCHAFFLQLAGLGHHGQRQQGGLFGQNAFQLAVLWLFTVSLVQVGTGNKAKKDTLTLYNSGFANLCCMVFWTCFLQLCFSPSCGLPARIQQQHLRPWARATTTQQPTPGHPNRGFRGFRGWVQLIWSQAATKTGQGPGEGCQAKKQSKTGAQAGASNGGNSIQGCPDGEEQTQGQWQREATVALNKSSQALAEALHKGQQKPCTRACTDLSQVCWWEKEPAVFFGFVALAWQKSQKISF